MFGQFFNAPHLKAYRGAFCLRMLRQCGDTVGRWWLENASFGTLAATGLGGLFEGQRVGRQQRQQSATQSWAGDVGLNHVARGTHQVATESWADDLRGHSRRFWQSLDSKARQKVGQVTLASITLLVEDTKSRQKVGKVKVRSSMTDLARGNQCHARNLSKHPTAWRNNPHVN